MNTDAEDGLICSPNGVFSGNTMCTRAVITPSTVVIVAANSSDKACM